MKSLPLVFAGLAALILLPASALSSQPPHPPATRPLPGALPQEEFPEGWHPYNQGLARAKALHKFALIQFYTPGCKSCQQMSADVVADPRLDDLVRDKFVLIRVNQASARPVQYRGRRLSEKQLAQEHLVKQYPTMIFIGPDGRLIGRKLGYQSPQELGDVLNYLATGAYSRMAFNSFQNGHKRLD